jgi:hypothetical protein
MPSSSARCQRDADAVPRSRGDCQGAETGMTGEGRFGRLGHKPVSASPWTEHLDRCGITTRWSSAARFSRRSKEDSNPVHW